MKICTLRVFRMLICGISITGAGAGAFAQSPDPEELLAQANAINIVVDVFSGLPNPVFQVTDSLSVHRMKLRMLALLRNLQALRCGDCRIPTSSLGYRGFTITVGDPQNEILMQIYDEVIMVSRNLYESSIWFISDPGREFERMIAIIGVRDSLRASNGSSVPFASIVPEELYTPVIRSGIITFEMVTETLAVDFSQIVSEGHYVSSSTQVSVLPDIRIRGALEYNYNRYTLVIESVDGISGVLTDAKLPNSTDLTMARDSLIAYYVPVIDSIQRNLIEVLFGQEEPFGPDVQPQVFLVKTTEGGVALFAHSGTYIGGINRTNFFWIYTNQESFDIERLRNIAIPSNASVTSGGKHTPVSSVYKKQYNLRGQVVGDLIHKKVVRKSASGILLFWGGSGQEKSELLIKQK